MLLGGKFVKPIASWGFVHRENLEDRLKSPITLIQAPVGSLLTGSLAAILEEEDSQIIWLRFGWEDFDPATCLFSLIQAFQVASEKVGAETLENMHRLPGPLQGWQDLYTQLGREIKDCFPDRIILVLENLRYPAQSPLTLTLLIKHFLPALPDHTKVILISQKNLPHYSLPKDVEVVGSQDLKLSTTAIKRIFQPTGLISDKECIRQAVRLMTGSPVGLTGFCRVGELLGDDYVKDILPQYTTRAELLEQIARDWLSTLDKEDVRSIGILLSLGYNHPAINQAITGKGELAPSPWALELQGGWTRPHRLWHKSIKTALRTNPSFSAVSIQTTAHYLYQSGIYITGIKLLFSSRAFTQAADYLAQNADQMLSLGQWQLLKYWMDRLPRNILEEQPQLLHASGEIKSASGDPAGASRDFQLANEQYSQNNDIDGKVASLLALSTLATHLDDAGEVWASAYKALEIAKSAALPQLESSAELQVGTLSLQAGDIQNAIQHLERAAELARIARDTSMLKRIGDLHTLALEHEQHQQQRKQQEQIYMAAQQAEQAHLERLQQVIRVPLDQDYPDWSSLGWLQAPLMLKLGGAVMTNGHIPNGKESLLGKISGWLRRGLENGNYQKDKKPPGESFGDLEGDYPAGIDPTVTEETTSPSMENGITPPPLDQQIGFSPPSSESPFQFSPTSSTQKAGHSLAVYCLGTFWVYLDKQPVMEWPSSKGKSVFKYLVTHREYPVVKEVLMDLFWPETSPDAARNNLNVAIYGLRQALRQVQPFFSHLLFQDDSYLLNPDLQIWVDYEAFTELLNSARSLERRGDLDGAMRRYCAAEALYQGEYMEEDRYEDWPILQRQHLHDNYLSLLDRLIHHYFDHEDHLACTTMCHKMLAVDPYREETHRYLMRSYLRQGHPHLALRQYHLCVKMLREELDMSPTPETTALYEQIRQAERI